MDDNIDNAPLFNCTEIALLNAILNTTYVCVIKYPLVTPFPNIEIDCIMASSKPTAEDDWALA